MQNLRIKMFAKIQTYFTSKTKREKILLLSLIWTALLIWFFSLAKNQSAISNKIETLETQIESANLAIEQKPNAQRKLQEARASIDETKIIKDLRVEVEQILNAGGFSNFSMSFVPDTFMPKMTVRTLSLSLQRDTIAHLIAFEQEILKRAPYMFFKSAEFTADSKAQMSARYEISSFEFKK